MMNRNSTLDTALTGLAAIGAINWGLRGLFRFNLVENLFGWSPSLVQPVYTLIGIAGAWLGYRWIQDMQTRRPVTTGSFWHTPV